MLAAAAAAAAAAAIVVVVVLVVDVSVVLSKADAGVLVVASNSGSPCCLRLCTSTGSGGTTRAGREHSIFISMLAVRCSETQLR